LAAQKEQQAREKQRDASRADRSRLLALRLTRLIGLKEQGPALLAAATELRTRAFALVLRTYEETRLAVAYLRRREGDADSIAPSLYSGKARRRSTEEPVPVPVPAAPAPASVPVPAPATNSPTGGPFL
jgi:hypothetical protein